MSTTQGHQWFVPLLAAVLWYTAEAHGVAPSGRYKLLADTVYDR
ncbi:MAG: hypothetical protein RL701_5388, partial [Pseudomonadota bacterium]